MTHRLPRRDFLRTTAAVTAGFWLGSEAKAADLTSANEKLNLAVVGPGGRGEANLNGVAGENIVAICDVDDLRAGKAYERFPQAKKFYDFRRMFDEMENQIDGVVISTPDHTHFHPAWWAIERSKHVYLEKPMAPTVWEARELTRRAAEKKLATQLGSQRHTLDGLRAGVEIVRSGALGTIKECHAWIDSTRGLMDPPTEAETVPKTLKWDLWLGPAAECAYSRAFAPYNWRFWWKFGTGEAGNWGCHILDISYWALDLKYPTHVSAGGPTPDPDRTPQTMMSRFEFPANDSRPAVVLTWSQAKGGPPILKELGLKSRGMNNLFIGSEGMLLCGFDNYLLLPEKKFADFKLKRTFPKSPGFYKEWFAACRGGEPATCNFDYTGPMAETVALANAAYRAQAEFDWDAATMRAAGNSQVEKYLRPQFRKGWEV
jgi:predicted dehydrogenase